MAITSGVSWNETKSPVMGVSPCPSRRWFSTAPHVEAAGDQMTGRGPSVSSSQPGRQQLGGAAGRLGLHAGEHALVADPSVVALVEVLGQAREEVELLRRHGEVGDDAVAWVAEVGQAVGVGLVGSCSGHQETEAEDERQGGAERAGAGHAVTSLQSECRAAMTPAFSVGATSSSDARAQPSSTSASRARSTFGRSSFPLSPTITTVARTSASGAMTCTPRSSTWSAADRTAPAAE